MIPLFTFLFIATTNALSTTNELFNRLKHYEIVKIKQKQFHKVDDFVNPVYPTNGELEFDAFGRHYRLWFHKNTQLFHPNFTSHHHNEQHEKIETKLAPINCYYSGKILVNNISSKSAFSACHGKGINGWIYAYDELIVIRPQKLLMHNLNSNISIDDAYIIYKYNDLDTSDYPQNKGTTTCGLDHTHINHHRHLLNNYKHSSSFTANSGDHYVELAVVNDPAMVQRYKNLYGTEFWITELQTSTISIINTVQQYYLDTHWGDNIGAIRIVLIAIYYISDWNDYGSGYAPHAMLNYISSNNEEIYCDECEPSLFCSACLGNSNYYQIDYTDYLTKFHQFRSAELQLQNNYDNAQLFSYYDFFSTVIGLASLPGMCIPSYSGGIEQTTYDDEYNGNIVAHEMGHNFNMLHDGASNDCNSVDYIMAASGSPFGFRPGSFSSCSIDELNTYFVQYPSLLTCLDNEPPETSFSICGNGIIEQGETCDCGAADCSLVDPCCDGIICSLFGDAECSDMNECCHDCKIKGQHEVCREKSRTNTCDIQTEYCDGISSQCPYDSKYIEGTQCAVINSHYDSQNVSYGYCYHGECISIEQQCAVHGINTDDDYTLSTNCDYNPIWRASSCGHGLHCGYTFDVTQCLDINGERYEVGTPCNTNIGNTDAQAMQCVFDGVPTCLPSSQIYTYVYVTSGWSECSIACRDANSTQIGQQTRSVLCALQDGTTADDINCELQKLYKPSNNRTCNDFVCDFCAALIEKPHICFPHGECDGVAGICRCHYGYGGDHCGIAPSLYFVGIASHIYLNLSGITIAERADPCDVIDDFFDIASNTQTVSYHNVSTLNNLYIGSVVGIRWNSTGQLLQLSVGMVRMDGKYTQWPFYVGGSLANDNQQCQIINSSVYDACYEDLSCNDFQFVVPEDLLPGYYKIVVRFNKEYYVESDFFNIQCTNNICNVEGNGECAVNDTSSEYVCQCNDNWYGDRCDESLCKPWTFTSNACVSDVFCENYEKPKCFDGFCNVSNANIDNKHLCDCDGTSFAGTFCELPNNHCNMKDIAGCNEDELCIYNENARSCAYNDCFVLSHNYSQCLATVFEYNNSWPIYCQWIGNIHQGFCDRIHCNISDLPACQNNAVRKPLFDDTSICFAWFCDCGGMDEAENWAKPSKQTLISSIHENYFFNTTLNASFVTDIDLFTCFKCNLNCSHSSVANMECSQCVGCDTNKYQGKECNHLYWIVYLKVNLVYKNVMIHYNEFEMTIIQDLAYFFGVNKEHLSIYEVLSLDDGNSVIVYFKYLFNQNVNDDVIQSKGGDIMMTARKEILNEYSPAITRGFILQYTDFRYKFNWCLPTKEQMVCNIHEFHDVNVLHIFGYCALCSYLLLGSVTICFIMYNKRKMKKKCEYEHPQLVQQQLSPQESPTKHKNYGTYSELIAVEGSDADRYVNECYRV